jgi:hypothetical protein
VVDEAQPQNTSIYVSTLSVSPQYPWNNGWNDETHEENEQNVMLVLPANDGVLRKVANIRDSWLPSGLNHHPTDMGVEKTAMSIVRVKVGVGVTVVSSMTS